MHNFQKIMGEFQVYGDFVSATPYGNGHINDTFLVTLSQARQPVRYILQRINTRIFQQPDLLMDNIYRICTEMHRQLELSQEAESSAKALTTIITQGGKPYFQDEQENFWRLYLYIENAIGYDVIQNSQQAYEAGFAFGCFQQNLTHLPGPRLHETIPNFHNTPHRFQTFIQVLDADEFQRKQGASREIEFFFQHQNSISTLVDLAAQGKIPERVTHNDTKLNNVLIDPKTNKAVCVIDLDTSMPGLAPYDFGDLVRTSTSSAAEDEPDPSRVTFRPEMFKAITDGYLTTASGFLTPEELDHLFFGSFLITYEIGLRFLTDYLQGNTYFKVKYPEHNLVRSRNQISLAQALGSHKAMLEDYIHNRHREIKRTGN